MFFLLLLGPFILLIRQKSFNLIMVGFVQIWRRRGMIFGRYSQYMFIGVGFSDGLNRHINGLRGLKGKNPASKGFSAYNLSVKTCSSTEIWTFRLSVFYLCRFSAPDLSLDFSNKQFIETDLSIGFPELKRTDRPYISIHRMYHAVVFVVRV